MKKIVPFVKDIEFNTSIYEITSISLEHNLKEYNDSISGEFVISGEYKESDDSLTCKPFIFNVPYDMDIDTKDLDKNKIEIDNFNYEIINDSLRIKVSLSIDLPIKEKEEIEVIDDTIETIDEDIRDINIDKKESNNPVIIDNKQTDNVVNSLFNSFSNDEVYVNYHVHIYREKDNLNDILKMYNITKEEIEEYNDLSTITIGSKLIIPSNE